MRLSLRLILAAGFRPFFLLAGLSALGLVGVWLAVLLGGVGWPAGAVAATAWHAHEMLLGFVAAAVAGFLLTAVPNWTATPPLAGGRLGALVVLWLVGRVVMAPGLGLGAGAMAVGDLVFLPALGLALAAPLIAAGKGRNIAFLVLLALLWAADLLFHLEWLGVLGEGARLGQALAIDGVVMMVAVIGGRIVPAFTGGALKGKGLAAPAPTPVWVDRLALGATLAMIPVDLAAPQGGLAGVVAGVAAIAHAARLSGWRTRDTLDQPIVWVLHLGYAWLPVALALKAASALGVIDAPTAWAHAAGVGVFATMTLGVMTRAALGHSGRALVAAPLTVWAYRLVTLAAALRVAAALGGGAWYLGELEAAGAAWLAAFACFLWVYVPIFLGPRGDGRPG